jgi:hypothetical protein
MIMPSAIERLEELLEQYDGDLTFEGGTGYAWSGTFRLTLTDPPNAPSRSITFYAAGGTGPAHCARRLLVDVQDWLATSGQVPMPVPDWKR